MDRETKILITGGNGFLGGHLRKELWDAGYHHLITPTHHDHNLLNLDSTKWMFYRAKPDVVIHLAAAVGGIGANQDNPGKFLYENMQIGLNVMQIARRKGVEKFINIGTVCAYPKVPKTIPFVEEELWDGFPEETNAPYGIAKKTLMLMGQGYREQYGLNCITLIPTNMYGPGDNFHPHTSHVIPAIINKIAKANLAGETFIKLWGTGQASREFLYVKECVRAIRLAMEQYNGPQPVNLGSGKEVKISELAALICSWMNFNNGNYNITYDDSKPDGQPRRCLNTDKARRYFGFENRVTLNEGLRETVEWYRETHNAE